MIGSANWLGWWCLRADTARSGRIVNARLTADTARRAWLVGLASRWACRSITIVPSHVNAASSTS